jgi:hypothetical protein
LPTTSNVSSRIRTGHCLTIKYAVQNLIDIFKDRWEYIIREELRRQVSEESYAKQKWLITQELNILKRVVKELSLVYKKPAERKAVVPMDEEVEGEDGEEVSRDERVDENYEESQKETNKDFVLQNINKYTNLVNHTVLKVNYRDNKLDYEQLNFNNIEVYTHPDDWMHIIGYKYYYGYQFPSGSYYCSNPYKEPSLRLSDTEGLALSPVQTYSYAQLWLSEDADESVLSEMLQNDDLTHLEGGYVYTVKPVGEIETIVDKREIPYKKTVTRNDPLTNKSKTIETTVLPFVLYSKSYPVDELLDFSTGNDVRDLNVNVAILMIWVNQLAKFQSFKQIVFNTDNPEKIPDGMRVGPDDIMINPTKEGDGSVQVLDLQTKILDQFKLIKERIMTVLAGYGISPENFSMSASPQSGFALKISNIGKLEARENQIPGYAYSEKELFDIERTVWNYHRPKEKISEESELVVDFAEVTFPKSSKEKAEEFNFLQAHNVVTEIDLIKSKNPDLTNEQALKLYMKNKAFNDANRPEPVQMNPIRQPGGNNALQQRQAQRQNNQTR